MFLFQRSGSVLVGKTTMIRKSLMMTASASSWKPTRMVGVSEVRVGVVHGVRVSPMSTTAAAPPEGGGGMTEHEQQQQHPSLVQVPTLPLFGSMVSFHSGMPPFDWDNFVPSWRKINKEYGPFYSVGIPGLGTGIHGTSYVIRDPQEMNKILQQEATYPSGLIEKEWPLINWLERKQYSSKGMFGQGAEWKRLRSFMQKDLLAPSSAREYLPAISAAAAIVSQRAPEFKADTLNRYMNYCAFDMFMSALLGQPDQDMTPEDHTRFLNAGVDGLSSVFEILREPLQLLAFKLNITTPMMKRCYDNLDIVHEIASKRISMFKEKLQQGDLTEDEKRNSYFAKIMERQPDSHVTEQEVMEICILLMLAAADTTAGKMGWNVVQLALNQSIQEKLYEQIHQAVVQEEKEQQQGGGNTLATVIANVKVPLLPAFVRETHRCTPVTSVDIVKTLSSPTTVHGVTLPQGTTVMFDSLTVPMDPDLVDNPLEFQPERWLKEAVEARKGTPSAIMDHPFYSGPFSQGARRCPGSRVANLEVQAMISQLLLDWKIEGPSPAKDMHWKDVPGHLGTIVSPQFPSEIRFVPRS